MASGGSVEHNQVSKDLGSVLKSTVDFLGHVLPPEITGEQTVQCVLKSKETGLCQILLCREVRNLMVSMLSNRDLLWFCSTCNTIRSFLLTRTRARFGVDLSYPQRNCDLGRLSEDFRKDMTKRVSFHNFSEFPLFHEEMIRNVLALKFGLDTCDTSGLDIGFLDTMEPNHILNELAVGAGIDMLRDLVHFVETHVVPGKTLFKLEIRLSSKDIATRPRYFDLNRIISKPSYVAIRFSCIKGHATRFPINRLIFPESLESLELLVKSPAAWELSWASPSEKLDMIWKLTGTLSLPKNMKHLKLFYTDAIENAGIKSIRLKTFVLYPPEDKDVPLPKGVCKRLVPTSLQSLDIFPDAEGFGDLPEGLLELTVRADRISSTIDLSHLPSTLVKLSLWTNHGRSEVFFPTECPNLRFLKLNVQHYPAECRKQLEGFLDFAASCPNLRTLVLIGAWPARLFGIDGLKPKSNTVEKICILGWITEEDYHFDLRAMPQLKDVRLETMSAIFPDGIKRLSVRRPCKGNWAWPSSVETLTVHTAYNEHMPRLPPGLITLRLMPNIKNEKRLNLAGEILRNVALPKGLREVTIGVRVFSRKAFKAFKASFPRLVTRRIENPQHFNGATPKIPLQRIRVAKTKK
jgi:hypothetical protein